MTLVDWAVVIIMASAVIAGMAQGFFRSVCSLGGLVLGLAVAGGTERNFHPILTGQPTVWEHGVPREGGPTALPGDDGIETAKRLTERLHRWRLSALPAEAFSGPFMAGLYVFTLTRRYMAG